MLSGNGNSNHQSYQAPTDQLMRQVAAGDDQAFAQLYLGTQHAIYALLLSLVKNPATAEDLMQDTYLSIRQSVNAYIPQGKPMAWIFTIAKNLAYQELRRAKKQGTDSYDDNEEISDEISSEDEISQALDNIVLRSALTILEERERKIVLLHVAAGMKFVEIASLTETPLGTVLSSYHRAMRKLQKSVREESVQ
ncbi:RNA polymerase sigma factor [Clostridium minihomine]|uniref:RNA polymerase sigma factor n=1 Tax=Clostridium minihomine TaxID=2045012 RepID=UPI000C75F2AD|nr:RNA polymerase sigma factor [Clostridium minihomine]